MGHNRLNLNTHFVNYSFLNKVKIPFDLSAKGFPEFCLCVDLVISLVMCACVHTYTCLFVSFRCMESVRYLPTSTLESNFKATPALFAKVDRWSQYDSSRIFFFHLITQRHIYKVTVTESVYFVGTVNVSEV